MATINTQERLFQWDEILEKIKNTFESQTKLTNIFDKLNLKYQEMDGDTGLNDDIRGAFIHNTNTVVVNSNLNDSQKYFTILHEVGHALLHKTEDFVDTFKMSYNSARETEANIVAYEIAMPIGKFVRKYNENNNIEYLARLFLVEERRVRERVDFLTKKGIISER